MHYWIGVTDGNWFETLRQYQPGPDEVNFWQPSERRSCAMEAGWPFLFKLRSPRNYIVGGGFFVRFIKLPCFLVWDTFREKNGVSSLPKLIESIAPYHKRAQKPLPSSGTVIGCSILTKPFFFEEENWIKVPSDWSPNLQTGRTYDTNTESGNKLWQAVLEQIRAKQPIANIEKSRFGAPYLSKTRLGQDTFRALVSDAYRCRCAVTGERSLPALEAAHIRDHAKEGPNQIQNGLLLRADVHRLFDKGYVTVDPDLHFVVSPKLREEFDNGREYYAFEGKKLMNIPEQLADRPSREFLDWHNTEIYSQQFQD